MTLGRLIDKYAGTICIKGYTSYNDRVKDMVGDVSALFGTPGNRQDIHGILPCSVRSSHFKDGVLTVSIDWVERVIPMRCTQDEYRAH